MRFKTVLITSFIVIIFSGCGSIIPQKLDIPKSVKVSNLKVIDKRPSEQSKTEMLSYIITNCEYGIRRLGDEWTSPNKINYLKEIISFKYPNAKELVIKDFVIYLNMRNSTRNMAKNLTGDLIGSASTLLDSFECNKNNDKFTEYTYKENPYGAPMMIGTLKIAIDDKMYEKRVTNFLMCYDSQNGCDIIPNTAKHIILQLVEGI